MKIYIPSMGRHTAAEVGGGPLLDIPAEMQFPVTYVVPLSECGLYREALAEVLSAPDTIGVVGVPDNIRGIAATRHWIGRNAEASGHDKFLMLDDDIRFLVRKGPEVWNLRGTTPDEVLELFLTIENWLDDYGHVGVSAREGNNTIGVGEKNQVVSVNTRTLRALAYRTADFLRMEHGRVDVMEDFDVNLQLLEAGIPNVNIGYWAQGQKMTNAPGGCSLYRSHEVQESSAKRLQELHGDHVVKLRQKKNKTDADGFGSRTEVTIQWKKAYHAKN